MQKIKASGLNTAGKRYPARSRGFAAYWDKEQLIVKANQAEHIHSLNQTAAHIWLMCDGQTDEAGLLEAMQAHYSSHAGQIARDFKEALGKLCEMGIVETAPSPHPARPMIRVAFCGFDPGFRADDNYFLWMLTYKFDPLVVRFDQAQVDLLFNGPISAEEIAASRLDRSQTIKVEVGIDKDSLDLTQCDFAFSPDAMSGPLATKHFQLPLWAMLLDWKGYEKAEPYYGLNRLVEQFKPELVCSRLYDRLTQPAGALSLLKAESHTRPSDSPAIPKQSASAASAKPKKLTIGMATYDDFDGVYFTIQAIRLYQPEAAEEAEFLVIDNYPDGRCGEPLKNLGNMLPNYRYIPFSDTKSTAVRDLVFRQAQTPYVLCMDSHVLPVPGSLKRLIDYFDANPSRKDLLQGPLLYDDGASISTHFKPTWAYGMYGRWQTDERGMDPENEPFEIPMQGLGLFACRKDAWVGFNPRFIGFGGEEGYLHEKFRRAGGRTLCLPFLRWMHRFARPNGIKYPNNWHERVRNYYLGFQEVGLDTSPVDQHFASHLGDAAFREIKDWVQKDLANPFNFFDAIYCINLDKAQERWLAMKERFEKLGILHRVRRFSAIETPESHHIGCALSHREIIRRAEMQELQNVLVFEDDAIFMDDTLKCLAQSIEELKKKDWKLLYMGGHRWGANYSLVEGCQHLKDPKPGLTCTHALAYHHSAYRRVLDTLPESIPEMRRWLEQEHGIDQWLRYFDERFLTEPVLASQTPLLKQEDARYRHRFTI